MFVVLFFFLFFFGVFPVKVKFCFTYGANPCNALAEFAAAAVANGVGKRKAVAVVPAGGKTAAALAARPLCIATPRSAARLIGTCVCMCVCLNVCVYV